MRLEPISKSPEEDNEAGELNEAKEVLWMIFPADEDSALPLDPGEEAFDQPAPQEASQAAPVLRRRFRSIRAVWRDHLDAILTQRVVERVTVVSTVADEIFRLGFDHVEVEAQLYEANFVMVRGVGANRERQAVAIHDRHDFHAFSTLGGSDLGAPALRHHESCVDEAFLFVEHAAFAQFVGDVHENAAQNLAAAPRLKAAMNRFVVRIALRKHVPLRAGVEYPKRPFKDLACRDRFAARPPVHNILFGKVMANPRPLQIAQPNHSTLIADRQPSAILR